MQHVRIHVTKLVDDAFPGWVEFFISGADGANHRFVEKASVVSAATLTLPSESKIACRVHQILTQLDGRAIAEIDTAPWGVESDTGSSRFFVNVAELVDPSYAA
ncbi:hypothetical protein GCM10027188_29490 [Lysobacter humi (ex Lee et al. 2017)]